MGVVLRILLLLGVLLEGGGVGQLAPAAVEGEKGGPVQPNLPDPR